MGACVGVRIVLCALFHECCETLRCFSDSGQRIYNFELSSLDSHGSWHRVLADATVGHKRFVVPDQELYTSALRFRLITGWEGGGALTRFVARFSLAEEFRSLRETLAPELKGM